MKNTKILRPVVGMMLVLAVAAGCSSTQSAAPVDSASSDAKFQRETMAYLASKTLEGRGVGTRGQELAAQYIAEQFRKAGLKGGADNGSYFQPYPYTAGLKPVEGSGATELILGGERLDLDEEFRPNSITTRDKHFSNTPLAFVGYGVSSVQYKYDDYAGIDVKGKVVIMLRFEPRDEKGISRFTKRADWSPEAALARKIMTAQSKGAVGVILVNPPSVAGNEIEDALPPFAGRGGRAIGVPVLQVTRDALDKLLQRAGDPSLAKLAAAIDESGKPASQALKLANATGGVKLAPNVVWAKNVIGILPGTGPKADEFVVVGAHFDHVGMGGAESLLPGVRAVHHGADDNASGTTAMVTLAKRLTRAPELEGRSIAFMGFSCEELGLIGSDYWTDNPTIPLEKIAFMLNLDMVGRMKNNVLAHGGEGTSDLFPDMLKKAYEGLGIESRSIGRGGFGPSDHQSFANKKIPVLFLFTGLHADYHRPSDTADKINYDGMLKATDVGERLVRQMVAAPRTEYVSRYDSERVNLQAATADSPASRPSRGGSGVGLGIMPDMTGGDRGMKIDGVREGSPAALAGMKEGDLLVELDGTPITSVEDLQVVYDRHQPGDKVKAVYERAGQKVTVEVTFISRGQRN